MLLRLAGLQYGPGDMSVRFPSVRCPEHLAEVTLSKDTKLNSIVQEYVLPDFSSNKLGRIRGPDEMPVDSEQVLYMGNERFSVPEVLFQPQYLGMLCILAPVFLCHSSRYTGLQEAGLAPTIAQSIALLPDEIQGMFWANIGLIGGNCKLPGFAKRLYALFVTLTRICPDQTSLAELRPLAPSEHEVNVYESKECAASFTALWSCKLTMRISAVLEAYRAAIAFAKTASFRNQTVTREEYLENGSDACRRKFKDWKGERDVVKGKSRVVYDDSDDRDSSPEEARPVRTRTRTVSSVKRR